MGAILDQLELNSTLFVQFGIVAVLFIFLSKVYFGPFLKLIELRHKKTVHDSALAKELMEKADQKYKEYLDKMNSERLNARKEFELVIRDAKKEETEILQAARNDAKKITQEAVDSLDKQKVLLQAQLRNEVEELSKTLVNKLLSN